VCFAGGTLSRFCGALPSAELSRPSGHLSARSVSFPKKIADFFAGHTGTASGRLPSIRIHLLNRVRLRLNKFCSFRARASSSPPPVGVVLVVGTDVARRRQSRLLPKLHTQYLSYH
jgi:hypothetical protein